MKRTSATGTNKLSNESGSKVLSMGAATIGDIFENHERGRAFSLYMAGPLLGPAIGLLLGKDATLLCL